MRKDLLRVGLFVLLAMLSFNSIIGQAYNTGYPAITNITATTATAESNATVGGGTTRNPDYLTLYIIQEASINAPTVSDVIDWTEDGNGGIISEGLYGEIKLTLPNTIFSAPISDLLPGENYIAYFVTVDDNYSSVIETTNPTSVSFSTPIPLTISILSPADDATGVSVNSDLVITFSEPIEAGNDPLKELKIYKTSTSQGIFTTDAANTTISGNELTVDNIDFVSELEHNTSYYIIIDAGFVESVDTGIDFGGISDNSTWSFTTEAASPPSIASLSPENNSTDVPVDRILTLTFEKGIQFNSSGTFNIGIFTANSEGPILYEGFEIVDGIPPSGVSILDNQIFIDPSSNFDYEKNYYITIENDLIQSTAGVSFGGISDNYIWSFTTEAAPTPSIASLSPENNTTDVPVDISLTLTFEQDIQFNPSGTFNIGIFTANSEGPILYEGFEIVDGNPSSGVSIIDNQIFIHPSSNFDYEKNYYINIESNLIQSTEGVSFVGISDNTTWSFTTKALTPPSIISLSPENNSTGASVGATLTLTFDANIKANPLTSDPPPHIYVKRKADDSIVLEYAVSQGVFENGSGQTDEVSISENNLFINPPADFDFSTDYYVTIDNGCLYPASDDTNLHPFAGFSDNTIWSFTTQADPASPIQTSFIPANNATDVPVDQTLTLTFNDNIKANPLSSSPAPGIYVKNKADDSIVLEYAVSGGVFENGSGQTDEVSISGNDLIINPPADFNFSTDYYVTIENGCLYLASDDANSHPFAGFSDNSTWSFTTQTDPASPTIVSFNPINNATDVEVDATLTLTFDANIKANPLSSDPAPGIYVKNKADDSIVLEYAVSGSVFENGSGLTTEVSISGNNLVISPPANLDFFTEYYVTIDNGCLYLASDDANSHPFAGFSDNSTWSFTTLVNPASPIIASISPIDSATNVPLNQDLIITFDREIQAGLGAMTIYRADDGLFQSFNADDTSLSLSGSQLTLTTNDFEPGISYYVLINEGFVESTEGVPFAGILDKTEWNFTVADSPIPIAFSPLDDAADVSIDQNLIITFDRDIERGSGYMTIFDGIGKEYMIISTSTSSPYYLPSGNQLIINIHPFVFAYEADYYVLIEEGFVKSATGASFAGISDSTAWSFTTQRSGPVWAPDYPNLSDQNAESLTLNGETDSDGDYYFVITGSPTSPTSQQIKSGLDEDGNPALVTGSGSMTANTSFSHSGIDISGLFPENSYYLHVVTKYQTVYSERRVRAIDRSSPTLYPQSVPGNGATNVPINIVINFQFSEKIFALDGTEINTANANNYFELLENTNSVGHSIEVSEDGRFITITPTDDLLENTGYKVSMEQLEDQYGNEQNNPFSFSFETDKINQWIGGGSVNTWDDQDNWTDGNYVSGKSVLIPFPATGYPTLEAGAEVNVFHLTLDARASLKHTGGTLNVGGRFTLKSSTDGNASYLPQGGTLNVTADSVFIEQVVTSPNQSYYISSPVSGATMRSMGLTETMYYFDNPTDSYMLLDNDAPLEAGKGYIFRNSADIVFTGIPHSAAQTVNVVRTANQGLGWNLIGNPFSATLNWDDTSIEKNNIEDSFWLWLNDQSIYSTYNGFAGLGTILSSSEIPSNQCFWVKVVTGLPNNTGSVVFPTSALVANSRSYLKSGSKGSTRYPSLKVATKMNNYTDVTALALAPEATNGIDVFDSDKFFSNNPNFCEVFTLSGNQSLAINGLPEAEEMEIPLGYSAKATGSCEFVIALNTLPENSEVFIKDKTLNTVTKITEGLSYPFEINATGKNTTRFALVLKNGTVTGIKDENFDKDINKPYLYTRKSEIVARMPEGQQSRYKLFDLNGKMIDNGLLSAGTENRIAVSHKGMVVLRIEWDGGIEEYKAVF